MHGNSLEMPWKCYGNVRNVPTFLFHHFESSCHKCKYDWLSKTEQNYLKYMEIPLEMPEMPLEMSEMHFHHHNWIFVVKWQKIGLALSALSPIILMIKVINCKNPITKFMQNQL